jgi:hypothetical protein
MRTERPVISAVWNDLVLRKNIHDSIVMIFGGASLTFSVIHSIMTYLD